MFSLKYTVGLGSTTLLVPSEEYANEFLDIVSQTRVIDTVTLTLTIPYQGSSALRL